ncbi:MAG: serine/threonine-protein kinase, partial [Planctomycetaceae bacterium]
LVDDAALTRTGTFLGTALFAAPEQVRSGAIDARSDQYSAGATLFCLLTGRGPFVGDAAAVIAQIASDPAPSVRDLRPDVPRELDRIIARTLEKDPGRRFHDLRELAQALLPFASGGTSIAQVGRRLAAFFIDMALAGLIIGMAMTALGFLVAFSGGMLDYYASPRMQVISQILYGSFMVVYFAVAEGRWGRGVGKWLMGLRVIDPRGEPPGLLRCALRAMLIPGVMWSITFAGTLLAPVETRWDDYSGFNAKAMLLSEVYGLSGWLATLLLLVTMRARNGYRGVHELISGTRVVRPRRRADVSPLRRLPVLTPAAIEESVVYGRFRVIGEMGRHDGTRVLLAEDESLGRSVWVYAGPTATELFPPARRAAARPTRPFWLEGAIAEGERWDAVEAVWGVSLPDADRLSGEWEWEEGRLVLHELAAELVAAVDDGSLPDLVKESQVWIDTAGRIKLIDCPLEPSADSHDSEPHHEGENRQTASARALALLRSVMERCVRGRLLPGHAVRFADELARRPPEPETLHWAARELRDMADRPSRLRWDDRLGVLTVSMGLEMWSYWIFTFAAALGVWAVPEISDGTRVAAVWLISLVLPVIAGIAFRGGPVFRLLGIDVRRTDNRPAGRLRCGWRNFVAWFAAITMIALWSALVAWQLSGPEIMTNESWQPGSITEGAFLLGLSCGWIVPTLVHVLGSLYAVLRPQRGLQDLLAGTCLMPR